MGLRRSFKPTNIVINGNFAQGTTEWFTNACTKSASANTMTATGDGTGAIPLIQQNIPFVFGRKYYAVATARVTNISCSYIRMRLNQGHGSVQQNSPAQNKWYKLTTVFASGATETGQIDVREAYADTATAKDKVMEVQNVLLIDLTALFGAGNEPTQAWCDLNIPNWFDGTLSTGVIGGTGGLQ